MKTSLSLITHANLEYGRAGAGLVSQCPAVKSAPTGLPAYLSKIPVPTGLLLNRRPTCRARLVSLSQGIRGKLERFGDGLVLGNLDPANGARPRYLHHQCSRSARVQVVSTLEDSWDKRCRSFLLEPALRQSLELLDGRGLGRYHVAQKAGGE